METRQPHVWSGLGSALPCPVAPDLPDTPAPSWTVFLWDSRPARLQGVSQIIAACGARVQGNAEVSTMPQAECPRACALAVVALEACPSPDDRGVEVIRSLQQKGFQVLCYADGAPSWPLHVRCQLLVAGAGWTLDSATAGFANELQRLLALSRVLSYVEH